MSVDPFVAGCFVFVVFMACIGVIAWCIWPERLEGLRQVEEDRTFGADICAPCERPEHFDDEPTSVDQSPLNGRLEQPQTITRRQAVHRPRGRGGRFVPRNEKDSPRDG